MDYTDDSDLNNSNNLILERKYKSEIEEDNNKNNSKEILITNNILNKAFISYNIIKSSDKKYEWPNNIIYAGFKFYLSTHLKEIQNKNILYIYYYCNNHRKIIEKEKNKMCNGKISYNKEKKEFYLNTEHSLFCKETKSEYKLRKINITNEVKKNNDFKQVLINYLNLNPLITYKIFCKEADKIKGEFKLENIISKTFYSNTYYGWRNKCTLFKWTTIFDRNKTLHNKIYLRNFTMKYINIKNKLKYHSHIIYCSTFHIKNMRNSKHFYIDATFINPKEYSEVIIILYLSHISNLKIPGAFILINSKNEIAYNIALSAFYDILTNNNNLKLSLSSISIDYELALINAINKVFRKVRIVDCYFHYMQALRRKFGKESLFQEEFRENSKLILKDLSIIPFEFYNNKNIIEDTFNKYKDIFKNNVFILNKLEILKIYYDENWKKYLFNGMLNYINITKIERSNAYLENYNRRIRHELGPLLSKKNNSIISWPIFLSFIINEEDYFRNKLIEKINNDEEEILKSDDIKDYNNGNFLKDDKENEEVIVSNILAYNVGKKTIMYVKKIQKKII